MILCVELVSSIIPTSVFRNITMIAKSPTRRGLHLHG